MTGGFADESTHQSVGAAFAPSARSAWLTMAGVVAITLLVFLPSLDNGFVAWDDGANIVRNPHFRGLSWEHIRWMFTTGHMGHCQPLSWMSFALDYKLWGMNPWGYHLTGLLLHAVGAGVFFWVARHLLARVRNEDVRRTDWGTTAAAGLAAMLFAIHPLRVESVAWATERRDVLSGLFFMVTLACYLRAAGSAKGGWSRRGWLVVSLVTYAAALLSKASCMSLPLVLVILDAYPLRRLGRFGRDWLGPEARRVWWEKLPYFILAAAAGYNAYRTLAGYQSCSIATFASVPWGPRLAIAFNGITHYLLKTAVPLGLSPLYVPPTPFDPLAWYFVLSGVVVVAATLGVLLAARRWPAGLALWVAYLVMVAPMLGLVQTGPQIAADRYTYLSCLGWAILVAAGWLAIWQRRRSTRTWRTAFAASSAAAVAILICLALLTRRQIAVWHDTGALWRQAVRVDPTNAVAHGNLGAWLVDQDRLEEALAHLHKSLELRPEMVAPRVNVGLILSRLGRHGEAVGVLREAARRGPQLFAAQKALGQMLADARDPNQAREGLAHLEEALRLVPDHVSLRLELAGHYVRQKQYDLAVTLLREGIDMGRRPAEFANALAWLLATCPEEKVRDGVEAVALAQRANDATGQHNPVVLDALAAALAETGRFDQAVDVARRAVALARRARQEEMVAAIERRLDAYRSRRPWRGPR